MPGRCASYIARIVALRSKIPKSIGDKQVCTIEDGSPANGGKKKTKG
jgi:hypothetical protein